MTTHERAQQQKRIRYWREAAGRDRATAQSLLELKRFDWSLFIYHLAIEKLIKALVVQVAKTPPPIHQLNRLAELAQVTIPNNYRDWLTEITDFNIEARYDDEKLSFYRKATADYAATWHERCHEIFIWLEKMLK